jgi:muramoyltetrapeptide carboxypeptidase
MSHIYIISPSGAVRDRAGFARAVKHLQAQGHQVETDAAALARFQRFAGDDATRLQAMARAADSGANVVLMARGGYGLTRLLADVPYSAIARAIERGSQWVGYSDFTALQLALLQRTGAVTWAGPILMDFGAQGGPDEITQACFDDLLSGQGEGVGWRLSVPRGQALHDVAIEQATLWGGNLTMVCNLLGTPYWPGVSGGILFLEETGEPPYRIERLLIQLLHAGVLAQQKAIVLGAVTEAKLVAHDRGFNLTQALGWLQAQIKTPILRGLPHGHVPTKVLLPTGAKVNAFVDVAQKEALLYWG